MKVKRKQAERENIENAHRLKDDLLMEARSLLEEMELEHQRGEDWVFMDEANAWASKLLQRLEMITVIQIDGKFRGQIVGAIK